MTQAPHGKGVEPTLRNLREGRFEYLLPVDLSRSTHIIFYIVRLLCKFLKLRRLSNDFKPFLCLATYARHGSQPRYHSASRALLHQQRSHEVLIEAGADVTMTDKRRLRSPPRGLHGLIPAARCAITCRRRTAQRTR